MAHHVLGTSPSILHVLIYWSLTTTLWNVSIIFSGFIDKEFEI